LAVAELEKALRVAEGRDVDPLSAPWDEIEKGVIKLLGGAFTPQNPAHQSVALMIASAFAERLCREQDGFWFQNREAPEGAALGFPDALCVVSPLEVSMQALSRASLPLLDKVAADLRGALAKARGGRLLDPSKPPEASQPLGPEDYQRIFDPGFIQFVCLEIEKAKVAWETPPSQQARDIKDALRRAADKLPRGVAESLHTQVVGTLDRLPAGEPLAAHASEVSQLVELLAQVHGAVEATGFGPAELWHHVLMPALHAGAAQSFPALDEDDLEPVKQGADPLLVYVDVVPYQSPTADEDGLLGVFPPEELGVLDECLAGSTAPRLLRVPVETLAGACGRFDAAALRASLEAFGKHLAAAAPGVHVAPSRLIDPAARMLGDLARVVAAAQAPGRALFVRRATESEAASEVALVALREALRAPRIILAT
jgi:hypothetical protein